MANEANRSDKASPAENGRTLSGAGGMRWRDSKGLALGEIAVVVLVFAADWLHVIPLSKTPFLFLLGWISLRMRGMRWKDIGLMRFRSWGVTLGVGVVGGIGMELIQLMVTQPVLTRLTGQPPDLETFRPLIGNPRLLLIALVLVWVLAAFGEETVYRGYLMNRVANLANGGRWGWFASLIVVSTVFGLAHSGQGNTGVIDEGIMGLLLGIMYLGCGRSLSVPIVAHGVQDTVDVLLIFLGKYPGL
jgi:membrane protease YdiL (CAAX protease family)